MNAVADSVTLEIDASIGAAYIKLSDNAIATTHEMTASVLVDLDAMNVAVGIEILSLRAPIPVTDLVSRFHIRSEILQQARTSLAAFSANFSSETARDAVPLGQFQAV